MSFKVVLKSYGTFVFKIRVGLIKITFPFNQKQIFKLITGIRW